MSLITIQALGRHCYLGQLYNATSTTLIPGFRLFNTSDIKLIKTSASSTDVKYEEVKSLREKVNLLNISAQLSVSILSGAIDISGMGSYLQNDKESTESVTVVVVGRYRTYSESLDVNQLVQLQAMTNHQLANLKATHVVTSITYGGNVVASLTQSQDLSASDLDIKGKFSLEVFKGMGKLFGAGASAELSVEDRKKLNSYNLRVKLTADFFSQGDEIPVDAPALLTAFKKTPSLIGEGVACEVTLAPLAWFQTGIPTFRELADADLLQLTDLYDRIIVLEQNRSALSANASEQEDLFPSFLTSCRNSSFQVSHLVQQARQELRLFLEATRSTQSNVKSPTEFCEEVEGRFDDEIARYKKDHAEWLSMMERVRAAKKHGFPPVSINELRRTMSRQSKETVAIILIPENVLFGRLLVTYRDLAEDIRKWRATIDDKPVDDGLHSGMETVFVSVYADRLVDQELLGLDDETKLVELALKTARTESTPVFLTYGLTRNTLAQLKWNMLNQEGWGVLVNRDEGWRYIGDVHKGVRHGIGVITYADGSVYQGDWFEGKRDESGELFPPQSQSAGDQPGTRGSKGVFVDDDFVSDGVIVKVTVYRGQSPIQFSHVALRKGDATFSHIEKIGRVLGWQLGKRYRLKVEADKSVLLEVLANGTRVDPSEDPDVESTPWPFEDTDREIMIAAIAL
ncbi:hypothetical protein E1B28_009780 [Marasmius oreades]|uniref:SNTX MACPF/CDC-like domain-containing protein n=1 Tax=Marasmius oreades TaxID=181124 RepID=A0A9P7RWF8_9AGAR|nr:uncharacterized protein E1B28_009780 [Marasmius oreades]KAG7090682.1 hypothetical protein E1B28_009780 [Marasmius oreades]